MNLMNSTIIELLTYKLCKNFNFKYPKKYL